VKRILVKVALCSSENPRNLRSQYMSYRIVGVRQTQDLNSLNRGWRWGFAKSRSWVRQSAARGLTRSERGRPPRTAARGAVARVEQGEFIR